VNIHQLLNMPDTSGGLFKATNCVLYKVIYSVVPPGLYYKDPPLGSEGVRFTFSNDLDSPAMAPTFSDGFRDFNPPELHEHVYVLLDVRPVLVEPPATREGAELRITANFSPPAPTGVNGTKNADKGKSKKLPLLPSYWSVLPLARERLPGRGYRYVNSGLFQVPLIEGPVPSTSELFALADPMGEILHRLALKNNSNSSSLQLSRDGGSILVEIVNPLLRDICGNAVTYNTTPTSTTGTTGTGTGTGTGSGTSVRAYKYIDTRYLTDMLQSAASGSSRNTSIETFAFNASKYASTANRGATTKTVADTLPELKKGVTVDRKALVKNVNLAFAEATGIPAEQ
jgi:hypothetical protein